MSAHLPRSDGPDAPQPLPGWRARLSRAIRHSVARNAAMLFIVSMMNYALPLILIPFLARVLGLEHFGVYAFGMSIYLIGMILIDYGFPVHGLFSIAEHRHNPDRVGRLLGAMLAIKLGLFVLMTLALGVYVALNDSFADHQVFLMLMALPVLGGALQFRWVFQAVEQSGKIVRYLTVGRVVQVVLVLAFIAGPQDYLWVPVIHGLTSILSGVLCIRMIHALGYRFRWPRAHDIRAQLRGASSYFWANVAEAQLGFAGIFSLSLVATPAVIGVYAVAEQLYRALRSLCHPLIDALMPYMKRSQDMRVFRRLCIAVCGITALGVAVGVVLAPWVIQLLFGTRYEGAAPILQILLPALLAFVPAMMFGYPLLAASGYGAEVSGIAVVAALAILVILAVLHALDALSGRSVAWTVVAGEAITLAGTLLLLWHARRNPRRPDAR